MSVTACLTCAAAIPTQNLESSNSKLKLKYGFKDTRPAPVFLVSYTVFYRLPLPKLQASKTIPRGGEGQPRRFFLKVLVGCRKSCVFRAYQQLQGVHQLSQADKRKFCKKKRGKLLSSRVWPGDRCSGVILRQTVLDFN